MRTANDKGEGVLTAANQRNIRNKVRTPCLFENTQTRKKVGSLTTVLTFSPSRRKFAGRKAEPPFLPGPLSWNDRLTQERDW
jgi:hypothetical protein